MPDTASIVIFGASGDLTHRKLIPSLFSLFSKGRFPADPYVIGVSRTAMSDEEFRQQMLKGVREFASEKLDGEKWDAFSSRLLYQPGDLARDEDLRKLDERLSDLEAAEGGAANRVYYLAIAPQLYEKAVEQLGRHGLTDQAHGWRRVVIEKPFGRDLQSAQALNQSVHRFLDESQIYRIDHYLGKETVQNILVFRFANSLFEPVWNRNYIDHVQITAAETVDVEHRAEYYDKVGVVRDMVQNHLLQLFAMVAIEPPASLQADALHNERAKLLTSIRPIRPEEAARNTVRGQYKGYLETAGVAPGSETPTFVALRLFVDNWRWKGVPFYMRSGKALAAKSTEISILFKRPPHLMFPLPEGVKISANDLSICIQPDEGIHFSFQAKVPDTLVDMRTVDMTFHYEEAFGRMAIPDAYERLLMDVVKGDASLFTRADSIELAWALVDQILAACEGPSGPPLQPYEAGSWGPEAAERLIAHDGYTWSLGCGNNRDGHGGS
jgi:glucose-6-phosphate 1-dehydrogenase